MSDELHIAFEPHNDEPKQFVVSGVDNHNIAQTGQAAYYPVRFYLRGADDEVLGGLIGTIWGQWLHVEIVWTAEPVRGQGHAREMLHRAEAYAVKRGCRGAYLETFSFQARPFYERAGYTVVGQIDDFPPGHTHYVLKKALVKQT